MAYSNANYLINSNKLSTKVHYAPGGASSLSLAWDDGPKIQKAPPVSTHTYKNKSDPPQNFMSPINQFLKQEQPLHKNYYEPVNPGFLNLSQSNRILEEELQYYQNRNKMLRSNIFGGHQNLQFVNNYSMRHPQYSQNYPPSNIFSGEDYLSYSQQYGSGSRGRQAEELDRAILQQQKRRAIHKQQSNYNGQYSFVPYGQVGTQGQEKPSVKVSNPPGGRSSIVFG